MTLMPGPWRGTARALKDALVTLGGSVVGRLAGLEWAGRGRRAPAGCGPVARHHPCRGDPGTCDSHRPGLSRAQPWQDTRDLGRVAARCDEGRGAASCPPCSSGCWGAPGGPGAGSPPQLEQRMLSEAPAMAPESSRARPALGRPSGPLGAGSQPRSPQGLRDPGWRSEGKSQDKLREGPGAEEGEDRRNQVVQQLLRYKRPHLQGRSAQAPTASQPVCLPVR